MLAGLVGMATGHAVVGRPNAATLKNDAAFRSWRENRFLCTREQSGTYSFPDATSAFTFEALRLVALKLRRSPIVFQICDFDLRRRPIPTVAIVRGWRGSSGTCRCMKVCSTRI